MWRVSATSCSSFEFEEGKSKKSSYYELKKGKLLEERERSREERASKETQELRGALVGLRERIELFGSA